MYLYNAWEMWEMMEKSLIGREERKEEKKKMEGTKKEK